MYLCIISIRDGQANRMSKFVITHHESPT